MRNFMFKTERKQSINFMEGKKPTSKQNILLKPPKIKIIKIPLFTTRIFEREVIKYNFRSIALRFPRF